MENSLSRSSADGSMSDGFQMQRMDEHHLSNQTTESQCGCMGRCGKQPSANPPVSQWRHYKSLAFLCISFHLIFASFLSLQALQSSFNATLGLISLAVLYAFFMGSCLLAPFVIMVVGPKYVISACYLCHCVYIATNYYPSYYTLIPGSIVLGCASGPLWASAGVYLVGLAKEVAQILQKEAAKYISIFVGIFFLTFFLAAPVGNAVASAILLGDAGGLSALANGDGSPNNSFVCMTPTNGDGNVSSEFVCMDATNGGGNASNSFVHMDPTQSQEVSCWAFYLLMSIFLLFDFSAFVMSLFGLDRISENNNGKRTCRRIMKQLSASLVCVGKMLFDWRFLLLAPVCGYSGIHIAIFAGIITRHFVTECLGISVVGLVLIVWGLFGSASSGVVGKLATKIPRIFIVMAGAVGDAAIILFLIFWERYPSFIAVFVVAIMFGLGDGVWNTIPTSIIGIFANNDEKETGYSLQRFWQAIGFTISFVLSSFASVDANLWFFLGVLVLTVPLYMITDIANTSDTKDFFKKVLRVVCCYSGVYSTNGCDADGDVTVKGNAPENSLRNETASDCTRGTPHCSGSIWTEV